MVQKLFKRVSLFPLTLTSIGLLLAFRFIKVSPLWGGCFSYFSLTDVLMPLSGLGGFGLSLICCSARVLTRSLVFNVPLAMAVYHIPGLFASFYWAQRRFERPFGIIVPLVCAFLFVIHPVGCNAIPYTFVWCVPVLLSYLGTLTPFARSLVSTFIAHSVGSVLWLYTKQIGAAEWMALIPVVIVERITFACIMTAAYYGAMFVYRYYQVRRLEAYSKNTHLRK